MNGGKERDGGECKGQLAQVPIGWQRKLETTGVIYISPSGSVLACLDQVKSYLLTDGTCKCGLECPLILPKVFNFDPGAVVKLRTAEDVKADEDVTKLCIHKRKLIAVATLHKSMELPPPSLTLTSPGGGTSVTSINNPNPTAQSRAIRSKTHESECKNPFKVMMAAGQRHFSPELCGPQQQDLYAGYSRQRLSSSEPGLKSPYRSGHGGMLSPPSQPFGDGSLSPRTDVIGSPDRFMRNNPCGFQGTSSPSATHINSRIPLSSPGVMIHSSPAAQQSSCVMAGRSNMPLSPPVPNKSPVMKKTLCKYSASLDSSRTVFHHKASPAPAPPMPPPCALQNKQVSSEKDPLGILDPIPHKPNPPPPFQPNSHTQVPMMNVNIPPAIVPLPSNLPLPTVKPGPVGHGAHLQRTQHVTASSISSSPVTSPVHMSGLALGRMEVSPQRSRSSSTSSEQGSFAIPPCSSMKVPPRSPRSSMNSPRPALPSSPSGKPDSLHQYKEMPNQLLTSISSSMSGQHNLMYPTTSVNNTVQNEHPGLLGMPLNQILNQHNAASFPASSLLSAAAKAQLANQNKVGGKGSGGGADAGRTVEGHSALNPMLPPNSAMMMAGSEGQSGRAALRDKLMAQQRDPLRKRKLPPNAGNHENNYFNVLKTDVAVMRAPCTSAEQMRKTSRLPPTTSMAQLLQSLSNHSSHTARGRNPGLVSHGRPHFGEGGVPSGAVHASMQVQQRMHGQTEAMLIPGVESVPSQFPGVLNQMQATAMGNCGPINHSGQVPLGNHGMGHVSSHFQQHSQPNINCMLPSSTDACCSQPITDTGNPSALSCSIGGAHQMPSAMAATGHLYQQQMHPALQGIHGVSTYQSQGHRFPVTPFTDSTNPNPNSLPCLYQDYQGCMSDSSQPAMTSHSGATGIYRDSAQKLQGDVTMAGAIGGQSSVDSVDAIYRAVVDAAGKGMQVTITAGESSSTQASPVPALSAMSAFTASIGQPLSLPHAVNAVIHAPRSSDGPDSISQPHRARPQLAKRTRRSSEQGKNTSDGGDTHKYFRSPSAATPMRLQWDEPNQPHWRGEEFLECSTQVHTGSCSSKVERVRVMKAVGQMCPVDTTGQTRDTVGSQMGESGNLQLNNCITSSARECSDPAERCSQLNGTLPRSTYGEPFTGDDQSPGSSTSLEGPLVKDYTHFNGHFNGHCAPSPSDTKSLSSEEELRHPDSPSADLLHYRPRAFNVGELVWPIKGFPPWPNKLMGEEHEHNPSMQLSEQVKVEPEQLKSLTQDLQALDRVSRKNRKAGNLNHHLEAAIHEAMSELDKMSGNVHADRQIKLPKPKRRKISR